jgi:hypothetical protein
MNQPVTMVTRDATLDDLSLTDYQDMVQDLRTTLSLDKLILVLGSQYSKPLWAKVEKGEAPPNRNQRNELRRYYGMPLLPPTVAEATATASPDAAVWQVGEGVPETVIMVTGTEPMTLHVNGAVSVADPAAQMPRNSGYNGQGATKRYETYRTRPTATKAQDERRSALGVKWAEIIERGLSALESEAIE